MYSNSPHNSSSVLVLALIAYCVYEHGYERGTATHVAVRLRARSCTLEDNGRGIGLHREGYVNGLVEQLAMRQSKVAIHGLGLAIASMTSPTMVIQSRRDGYQFTQEFSWGVSKGELQREPSSGPTGTRITFTLPQGAPDIDAAAIMPQVELWRAGHPGLRVEVTYEAEDGL